MTMAMVGLWALAIAIVLPIIRMQTAPPPITDDRVWYYDLAAQQLFVGKKEWRPPVMPPSAELIEGEPAGVRAMVYGCGECSAESQFVGYLQKYTPTAQAAMEQIQTARDTLSSTQRLELWEAVEQGRLVRRLTDDAWVVASSEEGRDVMDYPHEQCGAGVKADYCSPPEEAGPAIQLVPPPPPEEDEEGDEDGAGEETEDASATGEDAAGETSG